jgi:hypothetical protein
MLLNGSTLQSVLSIQSLPKKLLVEEPIGNAELIKFIWIGIPCLKVIKQ